ncbi:MAG TPA: NAD(P)-dependent oxidoreductase [Holophagaceae bacterium]|nr:NAD(P)-dependent oxidoreductase [Holophagaceae bacterium]
MSVRILATSMLVGPAMAELGARFPELHVEAFRSPPWETALPDAEALVLLLSEPLAEDDLLRAPRLKVIGTYSAGTNHLPVEACARRGIRIVNTAGVLTDATADLALALLLAVTRRISEGEALVRSGRWQGWAPDQLLGIGLVGKTCGILGSGPIGRAFAKRAWALGLKPIFWDRDGQGGQVDFGPASAPRMALGALLAASDVLSLHCPLTEATRGLLGRAELSLLPRGAVILNTARGGILDEGAVIALLRDGHLGGAGLDVYEGEPSLRAEWMSAPRAVLLPHLGSATRETRESMARLLCVGIAAVLDGDRPGPE